MRFMGHEGFAAKNLLGPLLDCLPRYMPRALILRSCSDWNQVLGPSFDMPPEGHQASLVSCDYRDSGAVAIYDSHALLAYLVPSRGYALGRCVPLGEKNLFSVFQARQYLVKCIEAEYTCDLHPRAPGVACLRVRRIRVAVYVYVPFYAYVFEHRVIGLLLRCEP